MQTKAKSSSQAKILYGENDTNVLSTQAAMLEKAGYSVQKAVGRKSMEETLKREKFDVVMLGHSLSRDDRHHLPYIAKKSDENTQVLVLHASGKHPQVDAAIDSRGGSRVILETISDLLATRSAPVFPESQAVAAQAGRRA